MAESVYPQGPASCNSDPNCTPLIQSATDPIPICVGVVLGISVCAWAVFAAHRYSMSKRSIAADMRVRSSLSTVSFGKNPAAISQVDRAVSRISRSTASGYGDAFSNSSSLGLGADRKSSYGESTVSWAEPSKFDTTDSFAREGSAQLSYTSILARDLQGSFSNELAKGLLPGRPSRGRSAAQPSVAEVLGKFSSVDDDTINFVNDENLVVMGYEQSTLGKVCMACVQALTATILSLYVLFLYGYYANCEFKSIDNLCFFGDYGVWGDFDTNSEAFFALWCVALVWFTGLLNWADQIRLFFLIPCSLCAAQLVWVWVPTEECSAVETTSAVLRVARALRKRVLSSKQGHAMLCKVVYPDDASIPPFFEFQCSRYVVHDRDLKRVEIKATSSAEQVRAQQDGLSTEMAKHRECLIGPNLIPFKVDTFGSLLLAEIQSLFYLYQLLVYMIWFWFSYTFIAAIMASVVVLSAVLNVVIKKSNQETIQTMTTYETTVSVKRNGKWRHGVSSHKLVPGDVILLQSDLYEWTMPCDAVLLAGTCVCDESGLTGESMPVQKVSVPFTERDANPSDSRHNLFAGTVLLQATGPNNDANGSADATALVTATGITSCKGQFIADILFPTKMVFEYDEELPLVVMILGLYALVAASMAVYFQLKSEAQNNFVTIFAYAAFMVSTTLSPLIPVALVVGQTQSFERLKKQGVLCINPSRIAICGKVSVFCFDKTGTLTQDGLNFIGHIGLQPKRCELADIQKVSPLTANPAKADNLHMLCCMASCHAVSKFKEGLVGNQVECQMFGSLGREWDLDVLSTDNTQCVAAVSYNDSRNGSKYTLEVQQRFEFDHALMTMSVVVKNPAKECIVYCKGSFEKIALLCDPASLPANYEEVTRQHALNGCYVLAVAYRTLASDGSKEQHANLTRAEVEIPGSMQLLGLLLFRNELKEDTSQALAQLKQAGVRSIMITGDNAQCGYYIAKESGMLAPVAHVQVPMTPSTPNPASAAVAVRSGGSTEAPTVLLAELRMQVVEAEGALSGFERQVVMWSPMAGTDLPGMDAPLTTLQLVQEKSAFRDMLETGRLELAVTGAAFGTLLQSGAMEELLPFTRIYARMTPVGKVQAVQLHIQRGLVTGMCGDGGNDCGALRVAHCGVALSEAEASVVSPFTSKSKSIASVVDLVKEGRCALVTSFSSFKFLIAYGQLFATCKLYLLSTGGVMPMLDYVCLDGVGVVAVSYAITLAKPTAHVVNRTPTSSLLSVQTIGSVAGVQVISAIILFVAVVVMGKVDGYVKWPAKFGNASSWWTLGDNWECTTAFVMFFAQYLAAAVAFSFGGHFRQPVWTNRTLVVFIGGLLAVIMLLLFLEPCEFTSYFHIASFPYNGEGTTSTVWMNYQQAGGSPTPGMPLDFRLVLFTLIVLNFLAVAAWESMVITGPVGDRLAAKFAPPPPRPLKL